jgi:hypothetical protein
LPHTEVHVEVDDGLNVYGHVKLNEAVKVKAQVDVLRVMRLRPARTLCSTSLRSAAQAEGGTTPRADR